MEHGTDWQIRTASQMLPQEYFILMELLLYVLFLVFLTLLVFGFLRWYSKFMGGG
jgi:TRAP-type C4-dicarboxylate transport system permease small subunit